MRGRSWVEEVRTRAKGSGGETTRAGKDDKHRGRTFMRAKQRSTRERMRSAREHRRSVARLHEVLDWRLQKAVCTKGRTTLEARPRTRKNGRIGNLRKEGTKSD